MEKILFGLNKTFIFCQLNLVITSNNWGNQPWQNIMYPLEELALESR